jgi:hypothetical protein
MNSADDRYPLKKNNPILSWEFVFLKLLLLMLLGVLLEQPSGSIAGRLALQQEGFNLYSYNLRQHNVYAIAIGPRGDRSQERGVWVNNDGTFKIANLPVGEYELKVHVPGYSTSYDSGIFVDQGKTTLLTHDVTLELEQPSIYVGCNTHVFNTHEQPHFWINANDCSEATVSVYQREMLPLAVEEKGDEHHGFQINADLSVYKPYDAESKKTARDFFAHQTPVRTWKRNITEGTTRQEFKFESPLPPGDYFAVVEGKNIQNKKDWNIHFFTVTDLGLIVKQDPWQTLVRAIDLRTMQPVAGADIKLLNRMDGGREMARGTTGADGFAKLARPDAITNSNDLIVLGSLGASHAFGGMSYYGSPGSSELWATMFYTDRPVYRLGQTVYFKGIVRKRTVSGLQNPGANVAVTAKVTDPDNNELQSFKLKTSDHGSFSGVFEIPKDSKTGAYQIVLGYPDKGEDYERFEVAEYRKPEYQVEVSPIAARITAGAKGKARVKATYYFGGPVANAKVHYTIFSAVDWSTRYSLMDRPDYYSYFDGWENEGEDSYSESSYSGDYVAEGYTVTDANGEAIVEFDTKRPQFEKERPWNYDSYDHKYTVQAEVTDISRLSVLGDGHLTVTNGDFELFVRSNSYVAKVGDTISADVRAVSYDAGHKPVANQSVNVRLYRRLYDRNKYEYRGIEIFEDKSVTTDANGVAHVAFATKAKFPTDTYEILATAEDPYHNIIADQTGVWVVSEEYPYQLPSQEAQKEPLTIKLDKDVYKAGETARAMITMPVTGKEGAQAIVCVEGAKLYSYRVVNLTGTANMVEVPLLAEYAPNVYLTVTYIGKKHEFYNESKMIKISPKDHFLNLAIDTDKQKYKPGDTAIYTVKATYADGKPAANTELSLGVVDESIYAIRPDTTPDIRTVFYNKRENAVTTLCTFPEEYSGGPNKIEPRVRKDFRDTAVWVPRLLTDNNGVARTTVKLPDNLTTWRATVVAIDAVTNVGSARQKIISTQPLILRLAMPRFFSQGDEGFITAVVHNYTDSPQPVKLILSAGNEVQVRDSLTQTVVVEPEKAKRYSWPVKVLTPGELRISCKAIGSSQDASDAMEMKLPIRSLGIETFVARSGVMTGDDQSVQIPAQLPPDAVPGSAKLHIYLSSSTLGSIVGNFGTLIDYPYGCTEQTMSKLMPSIVAMKMNRSLGMRLSADDVHKFAEVYKQSMDKLDGYQHDDGGWGWWADDTSQIYLTALVLDGYRMLHEVGEPVPADRQQNGLNWLEKSSRELVKQLSDPLLKKDDWTYMDHSVDLARAYYVLSQYKHKMPAESAKWLLAHKDKMSPEALSYLTMAFANNGDSERAKVVYDRLIELSNQVNGDFGSMMDWGPSRSMFAKLGHPDWSWYSFRYTDVETTALALQAVAKLEPDNSERIENIKRWIMLQRDKDGWANTKTTSEVFRALLAVELGNAQKIETNYVVDLPDTSIKPLNFNAASRFNKETDLQLPAKVGTYTIHKHGSGRLYYSSVLTYFKKIQPGEYVAAKAMPDGLKLRREFFRLKPSAPDSNGNVHFTAEPLGTKPIKAGETLLMKVYVDAPLQLPYVIVEAPLPSGAEVVKNDSRQNASEQPAEESEDAAADTQQEDPYGFGSIWWNHQDAMDDHLAFFVTELSRGKAEIHQMVRMEIPGKFEMNPVMLQGMYSKGVRAYSQANEITVVE